MRFLFKYPSLGRPEWFKRTLNKYYSMLSDEHEFRFLITLNKFDATMNNDSMKRFLGSYSHLEYKFSNHQTKIEAINSDMEGEEFDILFLVSDDMHPVVPSFDKVIAQAMIKHFPDLDGALHFNDGFEGAETNITLSIMGKKLYDHFGYIYHPDYKSFFCDTEFTNEVYRLNRVVYFPEVIVKHEYKCEGTDDTYKRNSKLGRPDKATYNRRKAAGFPR